MGRDAGGDFSEALTVKQETKTIFRVFHGGGEPFAMFPEIPADGCAAHCLSYARLGQHGACSVDIAARTRAAGREETAELREELARIGYRVRECRRVTPGMHAARRAALLATTL